MPGTPPAFSSDLHGSLTLPAVMVDSYSLALHDADGESFIGDRASRTAFCTVLDAWREQFKSMDEGNDPLGTLSSGELGKKRLDELLASDPDAAATIRAAIQDYAQQLTHVTRKFLRQKAWHGVERIIVGGGFQQSEVGRLAIARTAALLKQEKVDVGLRTLHHHADEGGLVGWVHIVPADVLRGFDGMLAVDIGGTNARCGIVRPQLDRGTNLRKADVVRREKWRHAEDDDATRRGHVLDGIAGMLDKLVAFAKKNHIALSPFVGVACPGVVTDEGQIAAGTQNLPGNWESPAFHLPTALHEKIPRINGHSTRVLLHNDAVVQGLSELPFTGDVKRWAVLTVGTGLGNASFTNR